jgi:hypothetical protein
MSKLNPQRFSLEEFPEQRDWLGKLVSPLNQFIGDVFRSYNNQITIDDNLFQEIKEFKIKNAANNFPYKFKTKFNSNPKGLVSIYVFNNDTGSIAAEIPIFTWSYSSQEINISQISGLTSNTNYTIRVLIIYG